MNYEEIKQKYRDYIVIQKQGIFYNVYGIDAYIISYIFDYQIKLNKVGFPNIDKVVDKLKINYIVINEVKKKFKNNNYSKYTLENITRMNKIINKLKNNIPNEEVLNKLESLI